MGTRPEHDSGRRERKAGQGRGGAGRDRSRDGHKVTTSQLLFVGVNSDRKQ